MSSTTNNEQRLETFNGRHMPPDDKPRMMKNMFAAAMIFAALIVISPGAAERSPAPTWCYRNDSTDDQTIAGCTQVIKSTEFRIMFGRKDEPDLYITHMPEDRSMVQQLEKFITMQGVKVFDVDSVALEDNWKQATIDGIYRASGLVAILGKSALKLVLDHGGNSYRSSS